MNITCIHCEHYFKQGCKTCQNCGFQFSKNLSFKGQELLFRLKFAKKSLEFDNIPELPDSLKAETTAILKGIDKVISALQPAK
jgi:hypothetical protein